MFTKTLSIARTCLALSITLLVAVAGALLLSVALVARVGTEGLR